MIYVLMHKDREVMEINMKSGACFIHSEQFMPYSLFLETSDDLEIDDAINNINNFNYWCANRLLTLDRKYAKQIFNSIGTTQPTTDKDRANIARSYKCLSLQDVYWVKDKNDNSAFGNINLYQNSLSKSFVDISLMGKQISVTNTEMMADNLGTAGVAPKAWIRRDNEFYLYKGGTTEEVHNEVLASQVLQNFYASTVHYSLGVYKDGIISVCKCLTSVEKSLLPVSDFKIYCANNDLDMYDYIESRFSYDYRVMNVLYYLLGNTDVHEGNWGFVVNNENNEIIGLAPLMDFNHCFDYADVIEGGRCLTVKDNMSQKEAAVKSILLLGPLVLEKEYDLPYLPDDKLEVFNKRLKILWEALENTT